MSSLVLVGCRGNDCPAPFARLHVSPRGELACEADEPGVHQAIQEAIKHRRSRGSFLRLDTAKQGPDRRPSVISIAQWSISQSHPDFLAQLLEEPFWLTQTFEGYTVDRWRSYVEHTDQPKE